MSVCDLSDIEASIRAIADEIEYRSQAERDADISAMNDKSHLREQEEEKKQLEFELTAEPA